MISSQKRLKIFIYARRSQDAEDRQVASIDSQIRTRIKIAEERGFEVVDIIEESRSAKRPGRAGFDEMMQRIESGEADGIVCWKLHRLSRNAIDGGKLVDWVTQQRIKLIVTDDGDFKPGDNVIVMMVYFAQAIQYSLDVGTDIRSGTIRKAERGFYPSPQLPIGYRHHPEKAKRCRGHQEIINDPNAFKKIQHLWRMLINQKPSVTQLHEEAIRLQITTRGGNIISYARLTEILKDPFYYGVFFWYNDEGEKIPYQGKHNPMITIKEFQHAQQILNRKNQPRKKRTHKFWYSNLFVCGQCKRSVCGELKQQIRCNSCSFKFSALHTSICTKCSADHTLVRERNLMEKTYYRCSKIRVKCSSKYAEEGAFETEILKQLSNISVSSETASWIRKALLEYEKQSTPDSKQIIGSLRKTITEYTDKIDRIEDKWFDDKIDEHTYRRRTRDLREKIIQAQTSISELEKGLDSALDRFDQALAVLMQLPEKVKELKNEGNYESLKSLLSRIGSNHYLIDKKPVISIHPLLQDISALADSLNPGNSPLEPENSIARKGKKGASAPLSPVLCSELKRIRTRVICEGLNYGEN